MPRTRYRTEQSVTKIAPGRGGVKRTVCARPRSARSSGSASRQYARWRKEDGGLRLDQAKRLKALE